MKRRAFTLVEMMVAVAILSLMLLYLYGALSNLQHSNRHYGEKLNHADAIKKVMKIIYLDLFLSSKQSIKIYSESKDYDIVMMQSRHSINQRTLPHIGYIVNREQKLYRVESSQPLSWPFENEPEMSADYLGKVEVFRTYQTQNDVLVDLKLEGQPRQVVKVRVYTP